MMEHRDTSLHELITPTLKEQTYEMVPFRGRARVAVFLYLHLNGLVTRSTTMARIRPSIRGPGISWPLWIQTTHGAAPGNRRRAATAPTSSESRFTARPKPH